MWKLSALRPPCLNSLSFNFLTKRILKDPIKVCLLSEPWSKPKTVSQHSELICRTVVPSQVISKKKRRDRIGHKYLPRIEPALIYCFPRVNIRNNLCTVFFSYDIQTGLCLNDKSVKAWPYLMHSRVSQIWKILEFQNSVSPT